MKNQNLGSITVHNRPFAGSPRYYPVCDRARSILALADRKVFTDADVRSLERGGFVFKIVPSFVPDCEAAEYFSQTEERA